MKRRRKICEDRRIYPSSSRSTLDPTIDPRKFEPYISQPRSSFEERAKKRHGGIQGMTHAIARVWRGESFGRQRDKSRSYPFRS